MGVHEHEVRTKTDRLIAAVEALTEELRFARLSRSQDAPYTVQIIDGYVHKIRLDEVATTS